MLDFDAGKYAAYVWIAFGLTAVVLGAMIVSSLAHARYWKKRAEELGRT
jgi:heme exporter protein D